MDACTVEQTENLMHSQLDSNSKKCVAYITIWEQIKAYYVLF